MGRALISIGTVGLLAITGCFLLPPVADNPIRVRGELVPAPGCENECYLELGLSDDDVPFWSLPIDGTFSKTMTVSPKPEIYHITVRCNLAQIMYRSEPLLVQDVSYFKNPIELGQVSEPSCIRQ